MSFCVYIYLYIICICICVCVCVCVYKYSVFFKYFEYILASDSNNTITGYVLSVSPMKSARKNNRPYFNLDLETENEVINVFCFSPSKRQLFVESANDHTGCEIQNATVKNPTTIFVCDYSTIRAKELGFPRTNTYEFKTVCEVINEVPLNTQVNLHVVVDLTEIRYITVGNDEVPNRDGFIIDNTANMKLTLRREYTTIESGQTFDFLRLVKIKYAGEIVLQSINSTSYSTSQHQIENYEVPERNSSVQLDNVYILAIAVSVSYVCNLPCCCYPG